ncbi:MAG: DUF4097 family beta strand repeat-containing protein [Terriglobales bacterium]
MKQDKSVILALALGTLAALLLTAHASAQGFSEEFHQTYNLTPGGRIELRNINGSVKISSWSQNQVKVDAVKWANRKHRLDEAKIEVNASTDLVSIRTRYPEGVQTFRDDDYDNPASVEYTLTVPAGARLDEIKLINGNLEVRNMSARVYAACINGKLTASGLHGDTHLSTINGRLDANFDRLDPRNRLELSSVNGNVDVTLPSDANTELTAKTVHGFISNDLGLPADNDTFASHKLAARLGAGDSRVELKNVNGSIKVQRAADGKPASPVTNLLPKRESAEF